MPQKRVSFVILHEKRCERTTSLKTYACLKGLLRHCLTGHTMQMPTCLSFRFVMKNFCLIFRTLDNYGHLLKQHPLENKENSQNNSKQKKVLTIRDSYF